MASKLLTICVTLTVLLSSYPSTAETLPSYRLLKERDFYFFSLLAARPQLLAALAANPVFRSTARERMQAAEKVSFLREQSAGMYIKPFVWSDEQIASIAQAFRMLCQRDASWRAFVDHSLRPGGRYALWQSQPDEELLSQAWLQAAEAANHVLLTYGEGKPPLYPEIDSLSYDPQSESYREFLHQAVAGAIQADAAHSPFFAPSEKLAVLLLIANGRDDAVREEPLDSGENAAAIKSLRHVDWAEYPYSIILVPGIGPELPGIPLSPMSRMHVVEAARLFRQKEAPVILLSGGFVHPAQTHFSEALEMKKALIRDFGIPESAILVDPYARHTTTNLRNASRQMRWYGIPLQKPALIASDVYQSEYITSVELAVRCKKELGYLPFLMMRRFSADDLEWLPNAVSLQQNPIDPLDP